MKKQNKFKQSELGVSLGKVVVGESNFVSLDKFSGTLVACNNENVGRFVLEKFVNFEDGLGLSVRRILIDLDSSIKNAEELCDEVYCEGNKILTCLNDLLDYAGKVKQFLKSQKCTTFYELKQKKSASADLRIVVAINNLQSLLECEMSEEIAFALKSVLRVGKIVGISVVATCTELSEDVLDKLVLNFENRLIFNNFSGSFVRELSWGMYGSTELLKEMEFYYLTPDRGNGSLLCL